MSKQTNPAKIGIFVLAALFLGLGTLAVVSSGSLLKKTVPFVMYFEGDVTGLKPGAPVLYRGVAVGQVTKIQMIFDSDRQELLVPVYIEIDPANFVLTGDSEHYPMMEDLVEKGLRAQLQTQSFVTGMLQVTLVSMPQIPVKLKAWDPDVREIPTAPALTEILSDELRNLNLHEMVEEIRITIEGVNNIVLTVQKEEVIENLAALLKDLELVTTSLNESIPQVTEATVGTTESIQSLIEQGGTVLEHADTMLTEVRKHSPDLLDQFTENAKRFQELQATLTQTVKEAENMMAQDSPVRYHLATALDRYTKLAASLEVLINTLERNPESILTGKPNTP